ncbi:MAG TPA: metallopeptidase family protein [Opitutaceae bacterium]
MTPAQRITLAEQTVEATRRRLPADLRAPAGRLPVVCHDLPSPEILGDEFEPDILGMFVGHPLEAEGGDGSVPPHILLFLDNLWDYAEADPETFREEVRITYLHELGHYFGWDEDELEARGLG